MSVTSGPPIVSERIVAFADLRGFHRQVCRGLEPKEIFDFLSAYYATAQQALDGSHGRIIKFIGDAMLIVFPAARPEEALDTLKQLKTRIDLLLAQGGHDSVLWLKVHVGAVALGKVGVGELERLDVFGLTVNQAALLPEGEWVVSAELQRKLRP
jgi:adenylate cyclase